MVAPTISPIQKEDRYAVRRLLPFIVLVALALRLAVIPLNNFEDLMDANHLHAWEQGNVAQALVAGHGFGSPFVSNQPSAIMPPVYPLIVAVFFRVFGVHTAQSIVAIHAFDCLINALACIPVFLLARRSFGERVGLWAAWVWAFFPYGIYFSAAWAWSTHLLLLCLCWLLYLAQDMEQSPRLGLWAGFGVLAGFAGLTEPSILVVIPFLLALAAWRLAHEGKRWLRPGVVALLALAATISPWLIRDAVVFHRFVPMRDSMGLELWMGNNGDSARWTSDDLHPLHDMKELAAYDKGELAYMDRKSQEAKTYIHEHREWYAWMCARRAMYLWTGYWSFKPAYLAQEPTDPENIPFATGLTLLGLTGLVLLWRRNRFDAIRYAGIMFLFPVMYYLNHPEPYHMRPIDPLIVILGCYAIVSWRERVRESAIVATATAVVQEA
ncbi:MAG TPA: glycosyltransferase family 39 protein [Terracidiphilus sp.]|nr:glycosyltransferase family 39 protein [Terracidiphilus sp.]